MEIITIMGVLALCAACYLIGREHGISISRRTFQMFGYLPDRERRVNRYV